MKMAKLTSVLLAVLSSSLVSATAGDGGSYQHSTTTIRVRSTWDDQPRHGNRVVCYPWVFLGRAAETILHSPQILAEGIEGDRALVNRRGVLAPREVPVEERIISPAD